MAPMGEARSSVHGLPAYSVWSVGDQPLSADEMDDIRRYHGRANLDIDSIKEAPQGGGDWAPEHMYANTFSVQLRREYTDDGRESLHQGNSGKLYKNPNHPNDTYWNGGDDD